MLLTVRLVNIFQNIDGTDQLPFFVTLNPRHTPENTLLKWSTSHPVPSVAASKASHELDRIQGKRGIWFCGAYQGKFLLLHWMWHFAMDSTVSVTLLF